MLKTVLSLSFVVGSRFFGLFIILPVFGLYASNLNNSNTMLAGVAIGIYALMQMIFQIPFGAMSDKFGRKNVMSLGLVIFIIGSLICGFTNDIYWMIFGRFLQGSGAVGSVAIAMISDFTSEEKRGKAMAIMGMMIGAAFGLSMVLGPYLSARYGLGVLFHISTALTLICIILLYTTVPEEIKISSLQKKVSIIEILVQKDLALMNLTNFLQKMLLTMTFFVIPIVLVTKLGFMEKNLWIVYSISMVFGFIAMGMAGFMGEKRGLSKMILLLGISFFIFSYVCFVVANSKTLFIIGVILFFIGFNMHEPIMQSAASKFAKSDQKGAVLGVFNAAGYFGTFVGGIGGGVMLENLGIHYLAAIIAIICIIWFLLLISLTNPANFKNIYLKNSENFDLSSLENRVGFIEAYRKNSEIVVKFNNKFISENDVKKALNIKE
ncbi:MFS transporter [Campylobacter ureolyticus]|uniref:MFS transporter n=1 Tax=Campylobacter ureolyticus TaxID=827 RepID=A0A9Q4KK82_9BACT|nr:MFS transporter [Campylobacter ureolyticus]MCR8699308.1 MFS transporter [Campylobacter ureolyticus]MCZ6134979.1 MFS transporter [Campylobacter ureolyticus]MCZ6161148.1 MFS transporter [Campylobacter ureolyticus]MCZ6170112.1 MFS transporter [Campylobacter ureolyticus]MDU7071160.1 MFS transporter [Campylobacter ureolyticus]